MIKKEIKQSLPKNPIKIFNDLKEIKTSIPSSIDTISNIMQFGTLISSISTTTGFNPHILILIGIIIKLILSLNLQKKFINNHIINNSIETLTINIYNLPITTTSLNPTPQFKEYLSIVNYLRKRKVQNTQYIADYNGQFNFLNNLTNIDINKCISFSSTYSINSTSNTINCGIILYSKDICKLNKFVKKCQKIYNKMILN
jgi:hypothetical protein